MTDRATRLSAEQEIRQLLEARARAVRDKDATSAMKDVAPEIVAFDLVNPLQYRGREGCVRRLNDWLASFNGAIEYELRELSIAASTDVAFAHCLNRVRGLKSNGQEIQMWWRSTTCFQKQGGCWAITHEHSSDPFDPATGKASLDLTP